MPSKSISVKLTSMVEKDENADKIMQRHTPEIMFGLNKNWMLHLATTFSDIHQPALQWESVRTYAKWRFYSNDDVHKHLRLAVFGLGTYSRNNLDFNEVNLMGDQSGLQGGLIVTQLWNKLAISATGSWNEVLNTNRKSKVYQQFYAFQAFNYSLSAGYLLLPFNYKNYNQTNVNFYVELLGSKNVNFTLERYYMDLAPSVQLIFKSTSKLNIGYRFQVKGDIYRFGTNSFMIGYEYIFLNGMKGKKKDIN